MCATTAESIRVILDIEDILDEDIRKPRALNQLASVKTHNLHSHGTKKRSPKSLEKGKENEKSDENDENDSIKEEVVKGEEIPSSFLPGKYTVYMRTWGCSHNSSDSEYMAGLLAAAGYKVCDRMDDAHLWLLNSCTVKTPSEQVLKNQIQSATNKGIPVVVAGCVPQAAPKTPWLKVHEPLNPFIPLFIQFHRFDFYFRVCH